MYCTACGAKLEARDHFCWNCGKPADPDKTSPWGVPKKLTRPLWDKKIGGVCAGFSRYFDIDVTLMRVLWLVVAIVTGVGFIAYLVAWIAMPAEGELKMPPVTVERVQPEATAPPASDAPQTPAQETAEAAATRGEAQAMAMEEDAEAQAVADEMARVNEAGEEPRREG
jgi:phage shock protein PspC (stress-responsive transcriptional regulator)